jgi:hypothetical protein
MEAQYECACCGGLFKSCSAVVIKDADTKESKSWWVCEECFKKREYIKKLVLAPPNTEN